MARQALAVALGIGAAFDDGVRERLEAESAG